MKCDSHLVRGIIATNSFFCLSNYDVSCHQINFSMLTIVKEYMHRTLLENFTSHNEVPIIFSFFSFWSIIFNLCRNILILDKRVYFSDVSIRCFSDRSCLHTAET